MIDSLSDEVKKCTLCQEHLPLGANPVFSVHPNAKIIIIGQAPGTSVHKSGIPWNDPSGERLRSWMGVDKALFYNPAKFAIMPMAFCYPGRGKSGDLPPRKECAPQWHQTLLHMMPNIQLKILIGQYAQKYYLKDNIHRNLTETVKHAHEFLPAHFPLAHPSPRNNIWLKKNPWMESEIIPLLRDQIHQLL